MYCTYCNLRRQIIVTQLRVTKKINEEEDNIKVTGSIGVEYKLSENKKGA